jgi:hypothetical protein
MWETLSPIESKLTFIFVLISLFLAYFLRRICRTVRVPASSAKASIVRPGSISGPRWVPNTIAKEAVHVPSTKPKTTSVLFIRLFIKGEILPLSTHIDCVSSSPLVLRKPPNDLYMSAQLQFEGFNVPGISHDFNVSESLRVPAEISKIGEHHAAYRIMNAD